MKHLLITSVVLALLAGLGWATSSTLAVTWAGVPLPLLLAGVAVLVNVVAFVPSFGARTEKYYDLLGSVTFLSLVATSAAVAHAQGGWSLRQWAMAAMVSVWTVRLGAFLFQRVHETGGDGRFDAIKQSASRFLLAWVLQASWCFITGLAVWVALSTPDAAGWGWTTTVGAVLWGLGFATEVVADAQKNAFRRREPKAQPWIDEGLWSRSRHPNYFGEITLWTGLFIMGAGSFSGGQWLAVLSPLWTAFLLLKVSGVPMVDARALRRWGDNADYQAYRARTRKLWPF